MLAHSSKKIFNSMSYTGVIVAEVKLMSYEGVRFRQDIIKTNSVRMLCATNWVEENLETFSMLFFM